MIIAGTRLGTAYASLATRISSAASRTCTLISVASGFAFGFCIRMFSGLCLLATDKGLRWRSSATFTGALTTISLTAALFVAPRVEADVYLWFEDTATGSKVEASGDFDLSDFEIRENHTNPLNVIALKNNLNTGRFWGISVKGPIALYRPPSGVSFSRNGEDSFTGALVAHFNKASSSGHFRVALENNRELSFSDAFVENKNSENQKVNIPSGTSVTFGESLDDLLGDDSFYAEMVFDNQKVVFGTVDHQVAPAKPEGLAPTPGAGQVALSWSNPDNASISKYQYQQKTGTGDYSAWADIDPSSASTTSHTVTGLTNKTEYTFRIRAVNIAGNSEGSDEVSATPNIVPAKPTDLTATPADGQVALNWTDPNNSSITKYQYQQKSGGEEFGAWTDIDPSGAATTSHTIAGLTNGTEYTFRIRAVNVIGNGTESDEVSAVAGTPVAAELTATGGTLQASLSWTFADEPSIIKWQYQLREGDVGFSDEWKDIPSSGTETRNYTVEELTGDVTYVFRIRAVNAHGDGASSNESQATPANPGTPTAAELTASLEVGQVVLSWTIADDPHITKWQYQQREGEEAFGTGWKNIEGSDATTRTHAVAQPAPGVTHGFRVRAVNVSGNGLASNEATVTISAERGPSVEKEKQVLTQTLAAVGNATLAGVTDVIDERLKSTSGANSLMLGGQPVGATSSSWGSEVDQSSSGRWSGNRTSEIHYHSIDDAGLLDGSAFTLSLSGEDAGESNSGWTMWGRGDYRSFEGKSGDDSWDGSVKSAWLGFDTRTDEHMLAGLAISRNHGEIDLVTDEVGSRVDTSLTAAWPYMQMTMPDGTGTVRVVLGVGSGDAKHHSDGGNVESVDLSMTAASVGARWAVAQQGELALSVPVKAEVVQLKTDGDGTSAIGGLSVRIWQASGGMEATHSGVPISDSGWILTPRGSLKFRWDGGDGVTGKGIEVGGGLGLHAPDSRLSLDASGHWLATHSDSNLSEWGASFGVLVAPDSEGRGWSASLRQEWGLQQQGTLSDDALFQDGAGGPVSAPGSLAARAGYGFGLMEGLMTVSADARLATGDEEVPHYGAGLVFALPRGLTATLRGEHVDAVDPGTRIGAGVQLQF